MSLPRRVGYAVLGAGPSGCVVATRLAKAGHPVVVVEASPTPQAEVGESLLPWGNRVLEELGVEMSGFLPKPAAVFVRGSESARFAFAEASRPHWTHAYQVPRDEFDRRLRSCATDAGVEFLWAQVQALDPAGRIDTDEGALQADFVIDAMGRKQSLARSLGLRQVDPRLRNLAMGAHFADVELPDPARPGDITITQFQGGWFWFIPFQDGRTSVGLVGRPDAGLSGDRWAQALARCPEARARLDGATRLGPMRGHQDFSASADRFHGPGWALTGDAALFLDPIFSSGVLVALESSDRLATALLDTHDAPEPSRRAALNRWEAAIRAGAEPMKQAVLSFYDGAFLDVAFCPPDLQPERFRQALVGLLAGDLFTEGCEPVAAIAGRIPEIANLVRSTLARRASRAASTLTLSPLPR